MNKLLLVMITAIFTISACSNNQPIPTEQASICESDSCTDENETVTDSQESKSGKNIFNKQWEDFSTGGKIAMTTLYIASSVFMIWSISSLAANAALANSQ